MRCLSIHTGLSVSVALTYLLCREQTRGLGDESYQKHSESYQNTVNHIKT